MLDLIAGIYPRDYSGVGWGDIRAQWKSHTHDVCLLMKVKFLWSGSALDCIIEVLRSCFSVYVNGKWPWIDVIGAQMQMSYRTLVRNFFPIRYDDTQNNFLFLVQSNRSSCSLCAITDFMNQHTRHTFVFAPTAHWIGSNTDSVRSDFTEWANGSLSESLYVCRWSR